MTQVLRRQSFSHMKGWNLESYVGISGLSLQENLKVPVLTSSNDILIKVEASSVNPLDVMMSKGYGKNVLSGLRNVFGHEHIDNNAIILGRDFSGTVIDSGMENHYKIGDEVYGATYPSSQGCHAEYVSASAFCISPKPKNLSHLQAASIPYVGLTAWAALTMTAGLNLDWKTNHSKQKILVFGASGGVGTFAVQLLKACNYSVVAVSRDFNLVADLGADVVLDYTDPEFLPTLKKVSSFDVILDFAGLAENSANFLQLLRPWSNAKLVTLSSPLLKSTDEEGIVIGGLNTILGLASKNLFTITNAYGSTFRYGYFTPNPIALQRITQLIQGGKIIPIIQETFKLDDLPSAYDKVSQGNLRGKIVLDHNT